MLKRVVLTVLAVFLFVACASSSIFPPIGTNLGNPLTVAVNAATNRLYVVNSNNKDLYTNGSVQVYNITTPTAPTLVGTAVTDSFSGPITIDAVNQFLYTPNRINSTITSTSGQVLQVNINEASAGFLSVVPAVAGGSPFGIACCDPAGQLVVASLAGVLDAYTLGAGAPTVTATNLTTTADDGTAYTNPVVNQLAIIGAQAFVTIPAGNILVVNLNKLGGTANPVDYVITNVASPRGIATDGTLLYVADVETINGVVTPVLDIVNPATLTAQTGNTTATNVAMSTILVAQPTMGNGTANTDPEQVVAGTTYVFVSCMGDDMVTVVNRAAQTVNTNITVGDQPFGMATLTPAGADTFLYVANVQSNTVSVIDLLTLTVTGTLISP